MPQGMSKSPADMASMQQPCIVQGQLPRSPVKRKRMNKPTCHSHRPRIILTMGRRTNGQLRRSRSVRRRTVSNTAAAPSRIGCSVSNMSRHGKYLDVALVQPLRLPPLSPLHFGPIDDEPANAQDRPAEIDDALAAHGPSAYLCRLVCDEQQARWFQTQQSSLGRGNAYPVPAPP